ncbi:MAG TPA: succinate dehydrogenase assembly factor 2 [Stellaceae bacterium]|nr:succinate dehydrogenase assembly factor 2 [Stellaceae bacterium]
MTSPDDLRRKRLLFRSWHRGTREGDLILGRFADAHLAFFDGAQLDRYEALLACGDGEIFDWVAGRAPPPPAHDHDVTRLLMRFQYTSPALTAHFEKPSPPRGERGKGEGGNSGAGSWHHPLTPKGEREKNEKGGEDTGEIPCT